MTRLPRILIAGVLLATVGVVSADERAPNWERVTADAGWQPRDSQGELVYQNQLWIFGGWFQSFESPPRDVWSSPDGRTWKRIAKDAPWKHSDLSMSLAFKNKMWFMGGWYNGRLPGHSASNQVWSSTDGAQWEQVTAKAGWTPRIAAALVEFKGRMWLLGGTENYYFGDAKSLKNDVWSSADGKEWTRATADAGWSPRAYHQAAVLNDKIYVFGGGNYVPEYHATNDVWCSADGVHWEQVTDHAPWHARLWFSSVVYRDRMWVLGGWSNRPSTNWGDAWYSKDGKNWSQLKSDVIWKERHEHSAFVFQDKIWIAGGHAQPLSSEVWSLDIPRIGSRTRDAGEEGMLVLIDNENARRHQMTAAQNNRRQDNGDARRDRFGIAQMLILVTGIAVGFWVMRPLVLLDYDGDRGDPIQMVPVFLRVIIIILGGISLVGVPMLLLRRRRDRTRWGPGKMAWFAHGTASWLLWPPILYWQLSGKSSEPWSAVCWLWGTPLMGIYMTASLLAGGWLRRRGRRGLRRNWSERFGLLLACAWACSGLYLLYLLYSIDLFNKE